MNNQRHYVIKIIYTFTSLKYKESNDPVTTVAEIQSMKTIDKNDFKRLDFDMAIADIYNLRLQLISIKSVVRDADNYTVTYTDDIFKPIEKKVVINLNIIESVKTFSVTMHDHDECGVCKWGADSIGDVMDWWALEKSANTELEVIEYSNSGAELQTHNFKA